MATIQLQGEDLRKAVKWISDERTYNAEATLQKLIEDACIKFDLSPKDAEFLGRFMREEVQG
ncbi:MAG: hypothetical protein GY795_18385 [Desulfobacterales bacterium]|nr:hypothetical protein [Desulfobacterales bacterium]